MTGHTHGRSVRRMGFMDSLSEYSPFDEAKKFCYATHMETSNLPGPSSIAYGSAALAGISLVAAALTTGPLAVGLFVLGATLGVAGPIAAICVNDAIHR